MASAQQDSLQKERSKFRQAEILFQSGQISEATTAFKALTKSVNTSEAAHFRLATIYASGKNYSQAIYHINQALEFCKTCDDYLLQKAQILNDNGQYKEAGDVYVQAINLNPNFWSRYSKAILAYKNGNHSQKAIDVMRLWEKQFQLKPEIGLKFISEFEKLHLTDSALLYAKKLILKYPSNKDVVEKTVRLYNSNGQYAELSTILKSRYLLDTSNLDYQLDLISNDILPKMEMICDSLSEIMKTRKECKYFAPRLYYKNNQNLIRKISFNKNLSFEQKGTVNDILFWSESDPKMLDSCLRANFPGKINYKSNGNYLATVDHISNNLFSIQKFKEAQPYFLLNFYNDQNLQKEEIETTLLCIVFNSDKIELEKCKNYLEEIFPFLNYSDVFTVFNAMIDKDYLKVMNTIDAIPNLANHPNKTMLINILAYSNFMNGKETNISKAAQIWSNMETEDILKPFLIPAYRCFKYKRLTSNENEALNMAYFLGVIDEAGKLQEIKNTLIITK